MTSFTVVKKGEEIAFDSQFKSVEDAKNYLQEHMDCNSFAMDLVSKNKLSEKQIAWLHYLATQDMIDAQTPVEIGEFLPLVQKIYSAVKNNTRKFKLRLPGVEITTVSNGANIGGIYILENGSYAGKITKDGVMKAKVSEDTMNLLLDANDNLLQLAKIYGHETGNCSVCGRTLNDPLSVQMGIGPICAKRFS
jgi:hypothetical protein